MNNERKGRKAAVLISRFLRAEKEEHQKNIKKLRKQHKATTTLTTRRTRVQKRKFNSHVDIHTSIQLKRGNSRFFRNSR